MDYLKVHYSIFKKYKTWQRNKFLNYLKKYDSATSALKILHWLPIQYRIEYKLLLTVFKGLHEQAPVYLQDLQSIKKPSTYKLRLNKDLTLIPYDVRALQKIDIFKRTLKTCLWTKAFN